MEVQVWSLGSTLEGGRYVDFLSSSMDAEKILKWRKMSGCEGRERRGDFGEEALRKERSKVGTFRMYLAYIQHGEVLEYLPMTT